MRYLPLLLLTGCLSASASHGSFTVRSTQERHDYGNDGQVMVSNVQRVVASHCENISECYEQIAVMCGKDSGFTTIQERWLISKGHPQPNNQFQYALYGLYFVLGQCK